MKKLFGFLSIVFLFSFTVEAQRVDVPSGYRGFLEYSTSYCPIDGLTAIELSTTHGCYFTDNAFIGMGIGFEGSGDWFLMPIFVTLKYNFSYLLQLKLLQVNLGKFPHPSTYNHISHPH